jgi:hypothetical protein
MAGMKLAPSRPGPGEAAASQVAPAGAEGAHVRYALLKPKCGDPCNHCGLCCLMETCPVGQRFFDIPGKTHCPALLWTKEGSRCGLMTEPQKYVPTRARIHGPTKMREAAKFLLGAGKGCNFREHKDEPKFTLQARPLSEIRKAYKVLGITLEQRREKDAKPAPQL